MADKKKPVKKKTPEEALVVEESYKETVVPENKIVFHAYASDVGEVYLVMDPTFGEDEVGKYMESEYIIQFIQFPDGNSIIKMYSDSQFYMGTTRLYLNHIIARFCEIDYKNLTDSKVDIIKIIREVAEERKKRKSALTLPKAPHILKPGDPGFGG